MYWLGLNTPQLLSIIFWSLWKVISNLVKPTQFSDPISAREDEILSLILRDADRKMFTCALCQFGASSRHKAFCHIESKHFQDSPVTYTCPFCGKTAPTKNAIGLHISRNHKHERGDSKNSLFNKDNSFYWSERSNKLNKKIWSCFILYIYKSLSMLLYIMLVNLAP